MDASKSIYIPITIVLLAIKFYGCMDFCWIESFPATQWDFSSGSGPYEVPWVILMHITNFFPLVVHAQR